MGDMGEMFKDLREEKKAKKQANLKLSTEKLKELDLILESHNRGTHLVIDAGDVFVDFWPSTGRWIARNGKHGRGVFNLIKFAGSNK